MTEPDSVPGEPSDPPEAREGRTVPDPLREAQGQFANEFSSGVSSLIRQPVELSEPACVRKSYAGFLASIREPTCCGLFMADRTLPETPPSGSGDPKVGGGAIWLEIPAPVAYAMIDSLLGGGGQGVYIPDRSLTAVERHLLRRAMALAAECLARCVPTSASVRPALDGSARPDARTDEPVAVWTFVMSVSGQKGRLSLCLPWRLLASEPPGEMAPPRRTGPVEISTALPDVPIQLEDLAGLTPGDILTTDTPVDGEVIVRVAGIPRYRARLGVCNRRRAITVTGPFLTPEPEEGPEDS